MCMWHWYIPVCLFSWNAFLKFLFPLPFSRPSLLPSLILIHLDHASSLFHAHPVPPAPITVQHVFVPSAYDVDTTASDPPARVDGVASRDSHGRVSDTGPRRGFPHQTWSPAHARQLAITYGVSQHVVSFVCVVPLCVVYICVCVCVCVYVLCVCVCRWRGWPAYGVGLLRST